MFAQNESSQPAASDSSPTRSLLTVRQFAEKHSAFTEGGLRHLIFYAADRLDSRGHTIPGNGFASAFVRVGRRVLIDEMAFFSCLDRLNKQAG